MPRLISDPEPVFLFLSSFLVLFITFKLAIFYFFFPSLFDLFLSFILKLQDDWAYREWYKEADRRLEGLAWVT